MNKSPNKFSFQIESRPPSDWDESIRQGETDPHLLFHASCWANRLQDLWGMQPRYLTVLEDGFPVLRLLVFLGKIPPAGFSLKAIAKRGVGLLAGECMRWYGQPVAVKIASAEAYDYLAQELERWMKSKRLRFLGGSWPLAYQAAIPQSWKATPWNTFKLDLTKPKNEILAGFKPAARKEIRKAHERDISVRRVETLEELRSYFVFAEECAKRYEKPLGGFEVFASLWEHVREWGFFETFVAYHEGHPIAGLSVRGDAMTVSEVGSFQSAACFEKKLSGPDLLKWTAIQWAADQHVKIFDLAGVNPNPSTAKELGIRRFKEKWSSSEFSYLQLSSDANALLPFPMRGLSGSFV